MKKSTNTVRKFEFRNNYNYQSLDLGLQNIADGVAAVIGTEFFRQLVKSLASALEVRYALVAEKLDTGERVRTLAYWGDEVFLDNIEFDLAGTPCDEVVDGKFTYYSQGVHKLFPDAEPLKSMGIESYLGVPLFDANRNWLGHIAVFHTEPFAIDAGIVSKLKKFCARTCMELERQRAEKRLRASEARLTSILNSAMESIITFDEEQHIRLLNAAAKDMFLCDPETSLGQPVKGFLSTRLQKFLTNYLDQIKRSGSKGKPTWVPRELTAIRSNGEEFPVEATLSPLRIEGSQYFTLILRDVNKRKQAELAVDSLQRQNHYLKEEIRSEHNFDAIIGKSKALRDLLDRVKRVAPTDTTALVTGETGTGKELIVRAINRFSHRRDKLLVKLNCAALPKELLESELFGHEKGAFTGALQKRKGRFELAHGGTLFLDEIGELSLEAQVKLLRVLQEQEFERVGGVETIRVDVRVVAATNRNLARLVDEGGFREDLFYRLNVIPLQVPPLRERREDIPLLVESFLRKFVRATGKHIKCVSDRSMTILLNYSWPGNIRELQNVIERAVVLARTEVLEIDDYLDLRLTPEFEGVVPASKESVANLDGVVTENERQNQHRSNIVTALTETRGKIYGQDGAAAILGVKPTTLASRMKSLGISRSAFGSSWSYGNC